MNSLEESWRRPSEHLFVWALALSLFTHAVLFSGYEFGRRHNWWTKSHAPSWMNHLHDTLAEIKKQQLAARENPNTRQTEPPMIFVEVDPNAATPEPPRDAKYYSSQNSIAANPKPADAPTPKFDGTQTHVPKTETAQPSKAKPLQPTSPPQPAPEPKPVQKEEPAGGQKAGQTMMAKSVEKPAEKPAASEAEHTGTVNVPPQHDRPRTLAQAHQQLAQNNMMPGQMMKQTGGVSRSRISSSLDVKSSAFGAYDAAIIAAVQQRWYDLIDAQNYSRQDAGEVRVEFKLWEDGRITNESVVGNTVGEVLASLCYRAIADPAPYAAWPREMREIIRGNYREITFTFYYE